MKWYCVVNEIKEESVESYREAHLQMHKTEWHKQLDVLKEAGADECIVYLHGNKAIMFYRCEDIDESFTKLGKIPTRKAWDEYMAPFFANNAKFDGSEKVESCELIFDLNKQLDSRGE